MNGMKFIKTKYEDNKEIVRVNFSGGDAYNSFISEVKKTYNLPNDSEVKVLTTDFVLKEDIFADYVAQYITNLEFVLDIKVSGGAAVKRNQPAPSSSVPVPTKISKPTVQLESNESLVEFKRESPFEVLVSDGFVQMEGEEDENSLLSFSEPSGKYSPDNSWYSQQVPVYHQLPSIEEIRHIRDFQDIMMVPKLENKHRTRLAKALIQHLQTGDPNRKLKREQFMYLADCIVEIFPSELKETYYVPFRQGHLAMGKLFDAYHNSRTHLRAVGLIPQKRARSEMEEEQSQKDSQDLIYVKANAAINEEFLHKWGNCLAERQQMLQKSQLPINEYLKQFPIFNGNDKCIFGLLIKDVTVVYPSYSGIQPWDNFYKKVFNKLHLCRDEPAQNLLKSSEHLSEGNSSDTSLLTVKEPHEINKSHYSTWENSELKLPSTQELSEIREIREVLKLPKIENKHRIRIAKAIITHLQDRDPDRKLMRAEFMQLAQSIAEIFTSELKETYYVPFKNGHLPKGKLYDAYNNNRTRLRDAGLIRRRAKMESEDKKTSAKSTICENFEVIDVCNMEILKTGRNATWDEIVTVWQNSHGFRQNELRNLNVKPFDYVDRYVVLFNEKCHELFEMDFKILYPNAGSINRWKLYYQKVIEKSRNMRDSWIKDIVKGAEEAEDEDTKLAISLMLVPYILPNPRKLKKIDVQESFISHSPNDPFVEEGDDEYPQTVKRLKIESEPKIHFIGRSDKMVSHAYVDMPGLRLRFDNPLKAFEEFCQVREIREMLKLPKLENKHRTKVAKIIIAYLLDSENDRRLMREDFYQLAQTITEIFPSELRETYYVPFKSGHLPKGKLYDAYKNHRTKFRVAGMIPTRSKATDWEDNQCTIVANAAILNDDSVEECDESEVVILTSGCASWDEVLTMWRKTHSFRQNELQNENMKPMEYIDKYVVLLNEKCYELLEMDFKMLYPNSKSVDQWKLYYSKVVDMTRNMRENCVKSTIQYVEESEDEVTKLAFALMLVPYILRNPRQRRKVEIQESFISYSLNDPFAEDDEKDCNQTVKRLEIESEPKIYFIGSASKKISHAYVDMLGLRLKFENPLEAFETCFHCFMTLGIPYPRSCMYVWILIQQLIFDVITKKDAVLPIITTLINDLNKLENNNI